MHDFPISDAGLGSKSKSTQCAKLIDALSIFKESRGQNMADDKASGKNRSGNDV